MESLDLRAVHLFGFLFGADLTRRLTKCINEQSSPTKRGISHSCYVLLATFHIRRWKEGGRQEVEPSPSMMVTTNQASEAKHRCFSHRDGVVFVPKPNQSVSRVLWPDRNCKTNLNKHKVKETSISFTCIRSRCGSNMDAKKKFCILSGHFMNTLNNLTLASFSPSTRCF